MEIHCPDCRARVPEHPRRCPACGLPLVGPVAHELWFVDLEIGRLTGRRRTLIEWLRASATARPAGPAGAQPPRQPGAQPSGPPAGPPAGFPGRPPWPATATATATVAEVSRFGVRNVLLVLGGALLGIAAVVFTVISWGELGLGVRALILLSLTGVALAAAWPLTRRMLHATAETVAMVGLVLIALECYAAYAVDLLGLAALDGRWYAVGAAVASTVLWAGYGRIAPLRLPRPTAIVLGQLPLPLAAYAAEAAPAVAALALIVVSAADLAGWRVTSGAERTVATVTGVATGLAGILIALGFSIAGGADPAGADAMAYAGVLAVAAAVALAWAAHVDRVIAVAGGLAVAVAIATPLPLPERWSAAGYAGAAVAVLATARSLPARLLPVRSLPGRLFPGRPVPARPDPARLRGTTALGAAVVLGAAVLWIVPATAVAAVRPVRQLTGIWSGVPALLPAEVAAWIGPAVPVVLVLLGAVFLASPWRAAAPVPAGPAALAVVSLPAVLNLPYAWPLVLLVAVAGALGGWAALDGSVRLTAGLAAAAVAVPAALASLVTRPATLAVLGALMLLSAGFALVPGLRTGATAVAVLTAGGFAAVLGLVAGAPTHWAAFGVLAGASLGMMAASWVRSVPAEVAGWIVAATAVAMTAGHLALFSLALALAGVLALGVSLRADRRPAAWAGAALMLVAFWIRLAAAGVTLPEAYAAPVSVGALLVGVLRRRRDRALSSWMAYGPGLACVLAPSLLAVWAETGPLRAPLLAVAAAAVTVVGARARLQAPLLLGGAVLLLDAVHELAPAVARVTVRLPGWFPIAVIGLVILVIGATYEQRLRDLRRLREAVTRLG